MFSKPQPAYGSFGAQPIPGRETGDPEGSVAEDLTGPCQVRFLSEPGGYVSGELDQSPTYRVHPTLGASELSLAVRRVQS